MKTIFYMLLGLYNLVENRLLKRKRLKALELELEKNLYKVRKKIEMEQGGDHIFCEKSQLIKGEYIYPEEGKTKSYGEMHEVCKTCGGPWPECLDLCALFN